MVSGRLLAIRLSTLILSFIIIMTWVFARHEKNELREVLTHNSEIAAWLVKEKLKTLPDVIFSDTRSSSQLIPLQLQMDRLRQSLNCKLYIISENGKLLVQDLHGGPLQTLKNQQLMQLPALKPAIESILHGASSATYQAPDGRHQIRGIPLDEMDAVLISDIRLPGYSQIVTFPLILLAVLGSTLSGVIWYIIRQTGRVWRRQNLAQSIIDPLTTLPNRKGMEMALRQNFSGPPEIQEAQSVLLLNLDRFSRINLHYGHPSGDTLLVQLAGILRRHIKIPHTVSRWSGDEFLIFLRNSDRQAAASLAKEIMAQVQKLTFSFSGEHLQMHLSIGIHTRTPQDNLDAFLSHVIQALQLAKEDGGQCIRHSDDALNHSATVI
ncbi:GGDEF domain-containing protein [Vibrio quintilis]|nr:GGDEF domain-containing protein [Vibrio quintilis]